MAVRIPDLGELIAKGRGEGGAVVTSYKKLEEAAGGQPTSTRWHQLQIQGRVDPATGRSGMKQTPEIDSVFGIAQALGYSAWTVWRSVGVSFGIMPPPDVSDVPLLARLARLPLEKLTPAEVDTVVATVRAILGDRG